MTKGSGPEIVAVYVVFGSQTEARRIGRAMIEQERAACVNLLGACHSIYRWQGKIEEAEEVAALFKTRADRAEALIAAIRDSHSYDVPAIVALPVVAGERAYLDWVAQMSAGADAD